MYPAPHPLPSRHSQLSRQRPERKGANCQETILKILEALNPVSPEREQTPAPDLALRAKLPKLLTSKSKRAIKKRARPMKKKNLR
jgi:hypothetical protein